jgi:lysyl-tRNA synthetase class 2
LAMVMTNSASIQDVLFFPQMRQEVGTQGVSSGGFEGVEIRKELIPLIEKLGISTVEQLKNANPNKLFNDLCGLRKKMKLEIPNPTADEVKEWMV